MPTSVHQQHHGRQQNIPQQMQQQQPQQQAGQPSVHNVVQNVAQQQHGPVPQQQVGIPQPVALQQPVVVQGGPPQVGPPQSVGAEATGNPVEPGHRNVPSVPLTAAAVPFVPRKRTPALLVNPETNEIVDLNKLIEKDTAAKRPTPSSTPTSATTPVGTSKPVSGGKPTDQKQIVPSTLSGAVPGAKSDSNDTTKTISVNVTPAESVRKSDKLVDEVRIFRIVGH